jgi:hypothetical protein
MLVLDRGCLLARRPGLLPECKPSRDDKYGEPARDQRPAQASPGLSGGHSGGFGGRRVEQHLEDLHRPGNVLDLLFAQIFESQTDLAFNLRVNGP